MGVKQITGQDLGIVRGLGHGLPQQLQALLGLTGHEIKITQTGPIGGIVLVQFQGPFKATTSFKQTALKAMDGPQAGISKGIVSL